MKRLINRRPSRGTAVFLGLLPFLLLAVLYLVASDARLAENPNDKLLPSFLNTLSSQKIKGTRTLLK